MRILAVDPGSKRIGLALSDLTGTIANPLTVYADPTSTAPDASDWRFGFITDLMPVTEFEGKKFNSPNDVVVKSDGTVWFTDPPYGLPKGTPKEQDGNNVFRFDPKTKTTTIVVKDFDMPNGLCFSPDEQKLYIADSGKPRHIRVFDVQR